MEFRVSGYPDHHGSRFHISSKIFWKIARIDKGLLTLLHNVGLQKKAFHFYLLEAAMAIKGYSAIPSTLLGGIIFLTRALPVRLVPTFIESLIGAMLTQTGFCHRGVVGDLPLAHLDCLLQMAPARQAWVALGVQLARRIVAKFPQSTWFLIFDDTFIKKQA